MSLQSRLFLFFTIIVVVPLTVAGYLAQRAVSGSLRGRDRDRAVVAAPGAVATYNERVNANLAIVSLLAADSRFRQALGTTNQSALQDLLAKDVSSSNQRLDFALVTDAGGNVLAQVINPPSFLPGVAPLSQAELLMADTPPGVAPTRVGLMTIRTTVRVSTDAGVPVGSLVAGQYLDGGLARTLAQATHTDITFAVHRQAVATSANSTAPWTLPAVSADPRPIETTIGRARADAVINRLTSEQPATVAALVISTPLTASSHEAQMVLAIIGVLALAAIGAAALGLAVSRAIVRPLQDLAQGADAISAGRYDQHIGVRSEDEVGQLAKAFNDMAERLSAHVAELRESREVLKRSLTRFGETLRSTHDLDKILQVVLDTSIDALRAVGGTLMIVGPQGLPPGKDPATAAGRVRELRVTAARGVDTSSLVIREGEGIVGTVAATGEPLLLPAGAGEAVPQLPDPLAVEPRFETGIWVPVHAQGRIFAVLSVFDRDDKVPFTAGDLDTVVSLSDQAGVAIDNVLLHQEAQRLAITDGMTGIWNHRYFQLRLDQEMDRAARFRRPFCLLLYDIDDFKLVNDTHGHLVGDAVLIELARRVRSEIRDIDVLARYGGEEFVLILPETDAEGGLRAAEKIRRAIAAVPFGSDRTIPVTVSTGLACFPRDGTDQASLLRAADIALYEAKGRGKDCTVAYHAAGEGHQASA